MYLTQVCTVYVCVCVRICVRAHNMQIRKTVVNNLTLEGTFSKQSVFERL
uniref:Uncharacterized protein n=1 Tax=Anguilla anguilla TaxID=7936 RepID=A0A0E9XET0_ANGAN